MRCIRGDPVLARIARRVDDRLVAARIIEAIGDEVLHALSAHVAERHRRAGWVFGIYLNPKGPVECRKSVKQHESCDDAECNDYGFERVLGVGGLDRSLARLAQPTPCRWQDDAA
jgi:hypothetical protein